VHPRHHGKMHVEAALPADLQAVLSQLHARA
jgi:hypothetical protein